MSFEDKFEKLTVSQRASDHINNQLLDKFSHKIKTDELSFSKAKTSKDKLTGNCGECLGS